MGAAEDRGGEIGLEESSGFQKIGVGFERLFGGRKRCQFMGEPDSSG